MKALFIANLKMMFKWLMRRSNYAVLGGVLLTVYLVRAGFAQGSSQPLQTLDIELWPDFDQPSTLVLLTGTLPNTADLPATVTLPIPANAEINAVARVDSQNNNLLTLDYDDTVPGQITFTTPDPQFRIEYYEPYSTDGNKHEVTFRWQADFDVDQLSASVQQPSSAANMSVSPEPSGVNTGLFGLLYHVLPTQSLPASMPFTIEASYEMTQPTLSQAVVDTSQSSTADDTNIADNAVVQDSGFNWPLVLAIVGVALAGVAVVLIFLNSNRSRKRVIKPQPIRRSKPRKSSKASTNKGGEIAGYCHECGEPARPEDKFCRNCGTELRKS